MLHYDYIISGAGASGMSLLYRMMQHDFFSDKQILVVDKAPKNTNDHTWCFWEKEADIFEPIVYHQWKDVHFYSNHFSGLLSLAPYQYKMIRSIDLYSFVLHEANRHSNVTFLYGTVSEMGNEQGKAFLILDEKKLTAGFIFNSILFGTLTIPKGTHSLLQHFKGWTIETDEPVFNTEEATLMDFRICQQHGTTFMYVLPTANNRALVEYTLFTEKLLLQEEYTVALKDYIQSVLKIANYIIVEEEFGVIPMTNIHFAKQVGNIVNMGTAGGQTKPSTGYTFKFIQKQCNEIVEALMNHQPFFKVTWNEKKFFWYDSVLLNVIVNNRMKGDEIFARMFRKNSASNVFRFLDNESSLVQDFSIINSLPKPPFLIAGLQEMFS